MHPAFSVIFLTTLIGAGQGLFLALFTAQSYALFELLPKQDRVGFYALGSALALVLLGAGLFASFFHLGRPERAWRAARQWRSSWLSREVLLLPAFMAAVAAYGAVNWLGFMPAVAVLPGGAVINLSAILGLLGTVLAFALFICTGMIYACLRFLQEWHTPLTVINFIVLGGASGFTLAAAYSIWTAPALVGFFAGWAWIITAVGLATRLASLLRNRRLKPKSTLQSAIGIKHPQIVQATQGAMGGSFNTREFFHGQRRSLLRSVQWLFLLFAFVLPLLLLAVSIDGRPGLLPLVWGGQFFGLILERWFFFAQANHPQNLYYRAVA